MGAALEQAGIIDRSRLGDTTDLAWPRIVTGFAIMSKRAADVAMVGWAVGATAVAGVAFAGAFWGVGKFLGIGLAGGTISLVSQNYGGDEAGRASTVVAQSLYLAVALTIPLIAGLIVFAEPLVGLLASDAASVGFGARYLAFVAPGLLFEYLNLIASRTYAGTGDTVTPMVLRSGGAALNVGLSAVLIFGLGLGVVGAAVGTTVSVAAVAVAFAWGMSGRGYLGRGASPVPVAREHAGLDPELGRQLLSVSTPLMARRVAEGLVSFPLLWIAGTLGPAVVAALEVARRVRALVNSFSWGFSIAASTLVGQRLGAGDEDGAGDYAVEITRLSALIYVVVAAGVIALAAPIGRLLLGDPAAAGLVGPFVVAAAVSVVPLGVDGSVTGTLRGAGDTTYPFWAALAGRYGCALPLAALATLAPVGVLGLYAALVVETLVPAGLNLRRFRSGAWKPASRRYRPDSADGSAAE